MAMKFDERIRHLSEQVGHGKLVASVVCDQVYAKYQHERLDLKHPHGGRARYLGGSLLEHQDEFMRHLAEGAVTEEGSELTSRMIDNVEDLAKRAMKAAPKEFGDLAMSMHPTVTEGNETLYDRPPLARRLTDSELAQRSRWRDLLDREHPTHLARIK